MKDDIKTINAIRTCSTINFCAMAVLVTIMVSVNKFDSLSTEGKVILSIAACAVVITSCFGFFCVCFVGGG
jgi:hypothetical protein